VLVSRMKHRNSARARVGACLFALLLTIAGFAGNGFAQERELAEGQARPLVTEDVEVLKPGVVRLQAGFAFQQDQDFPLSGFNGDPTRIADIGVRIGVSQNVEVQIDGTIRQIVSINRRFRDPLIPLDLGLNPLDAKDVGDFTIATKIRITREGKLLPALGVRFGFEMPNTNQALGIGTNTTNIFGDVIAGKSIGRARVFGNLGLGILQAPTETFAQNDVLRYGLGFRIPFNEKVRLVGEVNGRYSTRAPLPGTESRSEARLGVQVDAGGLRWDAAGTLGLTRWSPQSGLVFGVTYDIKEAFEPVLK
jgi:hypothetical protein